MNSFCLKFNSNKIAVFLTLCIFLSLFVCSAFSQKHEQQSVELGTVDWLRDYETALLEAARTDKPILILFQEVPGCATCRNYGKEVLSHPLLVEAIQNEFIPLAVYNNKGGNDRKVLDLYNEPTWNNPVVRIVDAQGKDIMERLSGNYSAAGLVLQMSLALRKTGQGEPAYLGLLKDELTTTKIETAYYQMYCFWSGESHLGAQDGVVTTEPGWMGGAEVVKVVYDKDRLSKRKLDKYALQAKCKAVAFQKGYRIDKDPQYYLKKSPYKYLPLSPMQKTKINAALASGDDATLFLSPKQNEWLENGKSKKVLYSMNLEAAWQKMIN